MTIAYVQRDPDAGTDRHSLIVKNTSKIAVVYIYKVQQ